MRVAHCLRVFVVIAIFQGCGSESIDFAALSDEQENDAGIPIPLIETLNNYTFRSKFSDFKSKEPQNGRNSTQQAVVDLNKYAGALIDEINGVVSTQLNEQGKKPHALLKPGSLYIRTSSGQPGPTRQDACFWRSRLLSTRTTDRDLDSAEHIAYAVEQLQNLAKFAGHQASLMGERQLGSLNFSEIELCTVKQSGRIMNYDPGTKVLQVSVYEPFGRIDSWELLSFQELQKMWNFGVQFTSASTKMAISDDFLVSAARSAYLKVKGKEAEYKIWQIINPIGPYRVLMREILSSSGREVVQKLTQAYHTKRGSAEEERLSIVATLLVSLLNDKSPLFANNLARDNFVLADKEDYRNSLSKLTLPELRKFIRRWAFFSSRGETYAELENANLRSFGATVNKFNTKIKTKITGFVAVGNAHVINVNANLFPQSDLQGFAQMGVAESNDTNVEIDAEVKGFIAVFTNDVINVQADIGGGIGTAGFVRALDSVVGNIDFGESDL